MYNIYTDILLMLYIIGILPSGRFSEFENEAFLHYRPQYMLCFFQKDRLASRLFKNDRLPQSLLVPSFCPTLPRGGKISVPSESHDLVFFHEIFQRCYICLYTSIQVFFKKYQNINFSKLQKILKLSFSQRRKKIKSTLCLHLKELEIAKIDKNLRPDNLTINDYCRISELIS